MNILYIEDDQVLAKTIQSKLKSHYNVDMAFNGKKAIKLLENKEYDLLIIDHYLPDTNGLKLCQKIRKMDIETPVLFFTVNDATENIIEALDNGADGYLTKPFSYSELEARIRALIRRVKNELGGIHLSLGELLIKPDEQFVVFNKKNIKLPRKEYLLLKYLALNRGKLISRQEIFEHVWGNDGYYNSNTIDVHIKRLKNRLKYLTGEEWIKSVYGQGYRIYNQEEN